MDRVLTGVTPDRDRTTDLARSAEWRRRKAAGRARVGRQLAESLIDDASALRRHTAALQGSGLGLDPALIRDLTTLADDIEHAAALVLASVSRSAA